MTARQLTLPLVIEADGLEVCAECREAIPFYERPDPDAWAIDLPDGRTVHEVCAAQERLPL